MCVSIQVCVSASVCICKSGWNGKESVRQSERANEYSKRHTTSNIININEFYDMEIKLNKSLKANKQNVSIHT